MGRGQGDVEKVRRQRAVVGTLVLNGFESNRGLFYRCREVGDREDLCDGSCVMESLDRFK